MILVEVTNTGPESDTSNEIESSSAHGHLMLLNGNYWDIQISAL